MKSSKLKAMIITFVCSVVFLLIVAGVILCTAFGTMGKDSTDKAHISNISVSNYAVEFDADITTSADFYSGYSYTIDGDKMYINVYSSLVNKVQAWPVHVKIKCDTADINQIYQNHSEKKTLLWERK